MWARLDDDFYDHPKVVVAGNAAAGLWVRCLSYSARYLTDGFVPTAVVESMITPADPPDLLERVERDRLMTRTTGGFLIPDYLDYNPSSMDVRERRQKQREGGRKGAARRWDRAAR